MENATKALLMAAGILIAIIVLSLAVVMYSRVSEYYQQKQRNITDEQLAAFNDEYLAYNRDNVTGFELVSLINKTVDFNQNRVYGASNTGESEEQLGDGYKEMSITVIINNLPNEKLFENKPYTYDGKNNGKRQTLTQAIDSMRQLENKYGASILTKLVSSRYYLPTSLGGDGSKEIKDILGKEYNLNGLNSDDLLKYEDYLAFKRATFRCNGIDGNESIEYKNGQIVKMSFTQN